MEWVYFFQLLILILFIAWMIVWIVTVVIEKVFLQRTIMQKHFYTNYRDFKSESK